MVRISGYGQSGPYRDRAGFGGVAEAMGGLRFLTGHPDRSPTRVGVSLGDQLAGLHAVIGTLMGLWAREHALDPSGPSRARRSTSRCTRRSSRSWKG